RMVKTTGDGVLVEFASVVDAVGCAVAIQRGMVSRNASVSKRKRQLAFDLVVCRARNTQATRWPHSSHSSSRDSTKGWAKPAIPKAATWRSNIATQRVNMVGCPHWQPTSRFDCVDRRRTDRQ